jgi:mevalonate kinase
MTNPLPADVLEERAAAQRQRLHESVAELRRSVRHRLDVKGNVREHFGTAASAAVAVMLALGYAVAGIFVSD